MAENIESSVLKRTIRFLIVRNVLLFILILTQLSVYFEIRADLTAYKLAIATACVIVFILSYVWHIVVSLIASKNEYIRTAFQDEYFKMVKIKSGYYGFVAMLIISIIFILMSQIFSIENITILIPSEITLFVGVLSSDISKIIQTRG